MPICQTYRHRWPGCGFLYSWDQICWGSKTSLMKVFVETKTLSVIASPQLGFFGLVVEFFAAVSWLGISEDLHLCQSLYNHHSVYVGSQWGQLCLGPTSMQDKVSYPTLSHLHNLHYMARSRLTPDHSHPYVLFRFSHPFCCYKLQFSEVDFS